MTEQKTIKAIQEAVEGRIEINKKLIDNNCQPLPETLEDIFIAFKKNKIDYVYSFELLSVYKEDEEDTVINIEWKPNITFQDQSKETKELIGNLLT